jgi:deoxycytidylate deaminase
MKIIWKTIRKAYKNWKPSKLIRCYHYAAAFDGNKMICFTQNNPIKTNAKAHRIGEQFNLPKYIEYPFVHAESYLISNLLNKYNNIDPNWSIVVMRINRKGLILGSKPCENCEKLLNAVGIKNIYYSTNHNSFCNISGTVLNFNSTHPLTKADTLV